MSMHQCSAVFTSVMFLSTMVHVQGGVERTAGHYPGAYCTLTDVVLDTSKQMFFYKSDHDLVSQCFSVRDIWPLQHDANLSVTCQSTYDTGHAFTIYYFNRGSNYFHLHYDLLIPMYTAIYHGQSLPSVGKSQVLMPTVETSRLQALNWNTDAFVNSSKYWIQIVQTIVGPHSYLPLDRRLLDSGDRICFARVSFGTPRVDFRDEALIRSFVSFVQRSLGITVNYYVDQRIGLISRSNRRKILNEDELVTSLRSVAPVDVIEFNGLSFHDQVALMQNYTVLVGMNGAGLTNALYLPPGGVAVQLVPHGVQLNHVEFGELLRGGGGGGYMEWHSQYVAENNASLGDTMVNVDEVREIVQRAVEMYQISPRRQHSTDRFEL